MKKLRVGPCLIGVGLAVVLLVALGTKASTVGVLVVALACPLMMFLMMRTMTRSNDQAGRSDRDAKDPQP